LNSFNGLGQFIQGPGGRLSPELHNNGTLVGVNPSAAHFMSMQNSGHLAPWKSFAQRCTYECVPSAAPTILQGRGYSELNDTKIHQGRRSRVRYLPSFPDNNRCRLLGYISGSLCLAKNWTRVTDPGGDAISFGGTIPLLHLFRSQVE
jgi:hypothetical protein